MVTKEVHRTLYDSCDIYAHVYLAKWRSMFYLLTSNRMALKNLDHEPKNENCPGDECILELCSKCPFYAKKEVQNGR